MEHLDHAREKERIELYRAKLSDREIGERQGVDRSAIARWRYCRRLPANQDPHLSRDAAAGRLLRYELGWSDPQMAAAEGVCRESIKGWRRRLRLPANAMRSDRSHKGIPVETLLPHVRRFIGKGVPPDIADEAASEMLLDICSGALSLKQVGTKARSYVNRAFGEYASRFGPRSLDEVIGDDGDFRLIDTLRDESADAWLEEMGASWH